MKVRVISYDTWEEFCEKNNLEMGVCQITDEQFMAMYESEGADWEFDSLQEFADEFNTDGAYAPTPEGQIIRFFPNE